MLEGIKDIDELHEKKEKIYDFYNPKINRIENELKNCDAGKIINAGKFISDSVKIFICFGVGLAGYGAIKLIGHSQNKLALESIVEIDDYEAVLDDEGIN